MMMAVVVEVVKGACQESLEEWVRGEVGLWFWGDAACSGLVLAAARLRN